ncbi:MAG TPA: pantoate--beta-alanine ligase [Frankiaceae bacterium]|nr:pantoate--beta-alanine ligase [Frankiaceae bacterium]
MNVVSSRADLATARAALPGRTAVVMTMGALHEGHRTLMREARKKADSLIVTIFVNPLQFGPDEDLDRYPRPFENDVAACREEGVDLVFAPTPDVVYPDEPKVRVTAGPMGDVLEGATRPGHFDGVLTVVAKLLHLTRPDVALFGQKDAQQLALIRRMVRDLDFGAEIVQVQTVREPDGLALSSRNVYLSPAERDAALVISRALRNAESVAAQGPQAVIDAARATLDAEPRFRLDYVALVDPDTLEGLDRSHERALLAIAGWSGSTRLIDNATIAVGRPGQTGMYSKET